MDDGPAGRKYGQFSMKIIAHVIQAVTSSMLSLLE